MNRRELFLGLAAAAIAPALPAPAPLRLSMVEFIELLNPGLELQPWQRRFIEQLRGKPSC